MFLKKNVIKLGTSSLQTNETAAEEAPKEEEKEESDEDVFFR